MGTHPAGRRSSSLVSASPPRPCPAVPGGRCHGDVLPPGWPHQREGSEEQPRTGAPLDCWPVGAAWSSRVPSREFSPRVASFGEGAGRRASETWLGHLWASTPCPDFSGFLGGTGKRAVPGEATKSNSHRSAILPASNSDRAGSGIWQGCFPSPPALSCPMRGSLAEGHPGEAVTRGQDPHTPACGGGRGGLQEAGCRGQGRKSGAPGACGLSCFARSDAHTWLPLWVTGTHDCRQRIRLFVGVGTSAFAGCISVSFSFSLSEGNGSSQRLS